MRLGRERKMEEQERERAVAEAEDWTNSTKTDYTAWVSASPFTYLI